MARRKMSDVEALEEIFRSDVELEDPSDSWWDSDEEEEEEPDTADRLDLVDVQVEAEPSSSDGAEPPPTSHDSSSSLRQGQSYNGADTRKPFYDILPLQRYQKFLLKSNSCEAISDLLLCVFVRQKFIYTP
ncbi:PREDICTED: uncharacterized protein LOC106920688 isoform X2 [Poecilia mexicana]|uniref:uncharacterized protein LOC106920688 isoform X2 n=1 Tax=Poecilia mexicana TaxID=48701 RepID=UPI00072DA9D2|nr:PREDICTED: uncharacterized protein LOC106920688 isoform X2 [Poecilia mexicana]